MTTERSRLPRVATQDSAPAPWAGRALRALASRVLGLGALLSFTVPAGAHHSSALYDLTREITIDGVVRQYEWANPHVYVFVETSTSAGEAVTWEIEASPPALMTRRGWSPTSFVSGQHVVIVANPAKNPTRHAALGTSLRKDDGSVLAIRGSNGRAAGPDAELRASSLAGTWLASLEPKTTGLFVRPHGSEDQAAKTWPLTAKGRDAVEGYDPVTNPSARCTAYTAPFSMVFPDLKTVAIGGEVTTIRSELDDVERVVHMSTTTHDGAPYTNQGHSIGRWEGKTLVVDTARFEARQSGNSFELPSSREKHLVERFELSDEGRSLTYRFTVEDPAYFTGAVGGALKWKYSPGSAFAARGCDPDNARRYLE
jgi:Family of unknown function (DUF6152)